MELEDGSTFTANVVLFCTGFSPVLSHLKSLGIIENNRIRTRGTASEKIKGLWLNGYGNWTGFASATLIGVGRSAKKTVEEVKEYLNSNHS